MKKYTLGVLGFGLLFAAQVPAQEHYTEGPVWQVSLIRVKPTQFDAYLTSLRQSSKPLLEEEKKMRPDAVLCLLFALDSHPLPLTDS